MDDMNYIGVKITYSVNINELTSIKRVETDIRIKQYMKDISLDLKTKLIGFKEPKFEIKYSEGSIVVDVITFLNDPLISAPLNAYALYSIFFIKNKKTVMQRYKNDPNIDISTLRLQTASFGSDVDFVLKIAASAEVEQKLNDVGCIIPSEPIKYIHRPKSVAKNSMGM